MFAGLQALEDEARGRGVDISALALAWVLSHPQMDAAIIGPRRPVHLEDALGALRVALTYEERSQLATFFPIAAS